MSFARLDAEAAWPFAAAASDRGSDIESIFSCHAGPRVAGTPTVGSALSDVREIRASDQ